MEQNAGTSMEYGGHRHLCARGSLIDFADSSSALCLVPCGLRQEFRGHRSFRRAVNVRCALSAARRGKAPAGGVFDRAAPPGAAPLRAVSAGL